MAEIRAKVPKKLGKQRNGRGFSRDELKKAGTSLTEATRLGIPVDARRKTMHEENVEAAKASLKSKKAARKSKGKPKG